jgi:hypothetical protein
MTKPYKFVVNENELFLERKSHKQPTLEEAWEITRAKWNKIRELAVRGKYVNSDGGSRTCGLCLRYIIHRDPGFNCQGCPVRMYTGDSYCATTPYLEYETYLRLNENFIDRNVNKDYYLELVDKIIDFIEEVNHERNT